MESNPTVSSHVDKFSSFGILLSEDEEKILNSDDEKSFKSIQMKMKKSKEYQEFKEENKRKISIFYLELRDFMRRLQVKLERQSQNKLVCLNLF